MLETASKWSHSRAAMGGAALWVFLGGVTCSTRPDVQDQDVLESGIRNSALNNVARLRRAPENEAEAVAVNLGSMVQRVSGRVTVGDHSPDG